MNLCVMMGPGHVTSLSHEGTRVERLTPGQFLGGWFTLTWTPISQSSPLGEAEACPGPLGPCPTPTRVRPDWSAGTPGVKAELGSPMSPLPLTCPHSTPLLNLDLFPGSLPLHPVHFLSPFPLELKPNIIKLSLKATFPDSCVCVPHPAPSRSDSFHGSAFSCSQGCLPPGTACCP